MKPDLLNVGCQQMNPIDGPLVGRVDFLFVTISALVTL